MADISELKPGIRVRIIVGIFSTMTGPVVSDEEARRVRKNDPQAVPREDFRAVPGKEVWVVLDIFGRPVAAPVDADVLEIL